MRSKTILAAALAGALGAPLAAFADSDSYRSSSPSAGASVNSNVGAQGSLGSSDQSASAYGQDRGDRYAQNEGRDNDRGRHRGRDDRGRDKHDQDRSANSQYPDNSQYSQNQYPSQGSSGQYNGQSSQSQYGTDANQRYSSNTASNNPY
jgi:hypothetical protein